MHINSVHEGLKNHKCDLCGKSFSEKGSLKIHIISVHDKDPLDIKEWQPHKKFTKKPCIKTNSKGIQFKTFKCDQCDKYFSQSMVLKRHINTVHEGQKNHQCDLCGKAFGEKADLKTHIKCVHEGLKNHKCDVCEKTFSQPGHLKRHINSVH